MRDAARTIAAEKSIDATENEIRGAAALYYLDRISHSGELDGSETLTWEAFDLTRNEPGHIVTYKNWIEAIRAKGESSAADEHSVAYLEFLKNGGRGDGSLENSVIFWARLVQKHTAELPRSVTFFEKHFSHLDLENLPAARAILASDQLYKMSKPPAVGS